jgi:hypothetical protein
MAKKITNQQVLTVRVLVAIVLVVFIGVLILVNNVMNAGTPAAQQATQPADSATTPGEDGSGSAEPTPTQTAPTEPSKIVAVDKSLVSGLTWKGDVPSITVPKDYKLPTQLSLTVLEKGKGETLSTTSSIQANYALYTHDGTPVEGNNTFETGQPASFSLQGVIPGWTYGLAGQKVGSKVLLVVPPEYGYGSQSQGGIPANETLIFVVEILAVN